jgi:hypothetical protein
LKGEAPPAGPARSAYWNPAIQMGPPVPYKMPQSSVEFSQWTEHAQIPNNERDLRRAMVYIHYAQEIQTEMHTPLMKHALTVW